MVLVGYGGAALFAPAIVLVLFKWRWPPYRELGFSVGFLGSGGAILFFLTGPASANPAMFGIQLTAFGIQVGCPDDLPPAACAPPFRVGS